MTSYLMMMFDKNEFSKYAVAHFRQFSTDQIAQATKEDFASIRIFKLFAFVVCMQGRELLLAAPESLSIDAKNSEQMIVELLNKSDLLSGGLEREHMNLCSE
jgi:hypothetical protein